ncbi:MAG: hypothetical protein EAX91_04085 [Candidatus Lokiarchaeota archaeon]|nr:hypothetical protein [Candidatus Lokiarchaeota archaeon]
MFNRNNKTNEEIPEQIAVNLKENETILYRAIGYKERSIYNIVMTDKKVYAYRKPEGYLVLIEYSLIKAISLKRKRKSIRKKDDGDLIIYLDKSFGIPKNLLIIPNVSNALSTISKVESILWHYGGFESRELNIEFPYEFQLSSNNLTMINKKYRVFRRWALIGFPIFIIGVILFATSLQTFPSLISITWLIIFALGIGLILTYGVASLSLSTILRSRENSLVLYQNRIRSNQLEIEFNQNILMSIRSSIIRLHSGDWGIYKFGIIKISPGSLHSELEFGPSSQFIEIIERIFITYLRWKNANNLLTTEKEIRFQSTPSIRDSKESLVNKKLQTTFFEPIDKTLPQFALVISHLEKDEEILIFYKPKFKLLGYYIFIGLSLLLIPCSIILYSLGDLYSIEFFTLLGICISVGTIFMCIASVIFFFVVWGKKVINSTLYIFTTQNLVIKFPKKLMKINYQNIDYINYKEDNNKYGLEFILKKPLEIKAPFPFVYENEVYIYEILKSNDLYNQILILKEHYF